MHWSDQVSLTTDNHVFTTLFSSSFAARCLHALLLTAKCQRYSQQYFIPALQNSFTLMFGNCWTQRHLIITQLISQSRKSMKCNTGPKHIVVSANRKTLIESSLVKTLSSFVSVLRAKAEACWYLTGDSFTIYAGAGECLITSSHSEALLTLRRSDCTSISVMYAVLIWMFCLWMSYPSNIWLRSNEATESSHGFWSV